MTERKRRSAGPKPRGWVRQALALLAAAYSTSRVVHACPICFQADDEAMSAGVRAAVGVLFLVTVAVIGSMAAFAMRLVRAEAVAASERPVPERPVPERPVPGRPVPL